MLSFSVTADRICGVPNPLLPRFAWRSSADSPFRVDACRSSASLAAAPAPSAAGAAAAAASDDHEPRGPAGRTVARVRTPPATPTPQTARADAYASRSVGIRIAGGGGSDAAAVALRSQLLDLQTRGSSQVAAFSSALQRRREAESEVATVEARIASLSRELMSLSLSLSGEQPQTRTTSTGAPQHGRVRDVDATPSRLQDRQDHDQRAHANGHARAPLRHQVQLLRAGLSELSRTEAQARAAEDEAFAAVEETQRAIDAAVSQLHALGIAIEPIAAASISRGGLPDNARALARASTAPHQSKL